MSELQRDIELVAGEICHESEAWPALNRIRARLTPDRERVARAICAVALGDKTFWRKQATKGDKDHWRACADAAIAAQGETP